MEAFLRFEILNYAKEDMNDSHNMSVNDNNNETESHSNNDIFATTVVYDRNRSLNSNDCNNSKLNDYLQFESRFKYNNFTSNN